MNKKYANQMIEILDSEIRKIQEEAKYELELHENNAIDSSEVEKTRMIDNHELQRYQKLISISTFLKFMDMYL